ATATPVPTAEPTATPYTFEGYQTEVANYIKTLGESNVSETFFREFIRKQILREKVMEAFTADQPAAEEKVWAHHFLVQDETEAKLISERLKSGVEWNVIAAEIAQDTTGEKRMEDLGWFARGAMVKEFEDAAFSLEVGAISDPVKSSFGYHIIQVLGHEDRPLSAAEWMSARQEAFQTWLDEQRASDLVEEFDRWMDYVPVEPTLPAEIRVPLS
ncbi:peptidylprolyl isomerase, partial [Levilinea saccharolytica]